MPSSADCIGSSMSLENCRSECERLSQKMMQSPCYQHTAMVVSIVASLGLLVLATYGGAAGHMSGRAVGAAIIGIEVGIYLVNLSRPLKHHAFVKKEITSATLLMLVLGILGCVGALPATELGWSYIGLYTAHIVVMNMMMKKYSPPAKF